MQCCQGWVGVPMLSPAMLRILRWLDDHPSALETAWDVPRSLSLEGIADGIGVVRSALFQPMSTMEEQGLIHTRQATSSVVDAGNGKSFTSQNWDETISVQALMTFRNHVRERR